MSPADKLAQVGNTVFFGFDSAELSTESKDTLDRQAAFLNVNPTLVVVVEGHADERGTREYNLALGDRRAVSVRDYLLAGVEYGADPHSVLWQRASSHRWLDRRCIG